MNTDNRKKIRDKHHSVKAVDCLDTKTNKPALFYSEANVDAIQLETSHQAKLELLEEIEKYIKINDGFIGSSGLSDLLSELRKQLEQC